MITFPQFAFATLPLFAVAAASLPAQAGQDLHRRKLPAAYVADAEASAPVPDAAGNGCLVVLVALDDRMQRPAPALPMLLADAQVHVAQVWHGEPEIESVALPILRGRRYYAQVVVLDAVRLTLRARQPVPIGEEEGDVLPDGTDRPARVLKTREPAAPREEEPSLDELASQMKFWIERHEDEGYSELHATFRTARSGYRWSGLSHAYETADGLCVYLVLEAPMGGGGYLFVPAQLATSVAIPMAAGAARIFLGIQRPDGVAPEFVQVMSL